MRYRGQRPWCAGGGLLVLNKTKLGLLTNGAMWHKVIFVRVSATTPYAKDYIMTKSDKRKQSLYFPEKMLDEIAAEATRQDRSLSWIVQKAWKIAKSDICKYPSVNDGEEEEEEQEE
jgi:uncharacterized small protein (TIGR04563 family)